MDNSFVLEYSGGYISGERMNKYMSDLEALKQVYQLEIQAAGVSAGDSGSRQQC